MSKIGLQSQSGVIQDLGKVVAKKPISWKLLGNSLNLGIAQTIRERSPQTFIVLRTGGNWAVDDDTFILRYCDEAARLADPFLAQGLCDLLEPPNEPVVKTVELAKLLNERQVQYAQTMKARGYRVGAYNFSVGNPDYPLWPYLLDGIRASDGWLLLHEYGARGMQDNAPSLALRHRNVYPLLPPDVQANLKIGITESGIDLGNVGLAGGYGKYYPTNDQQESIDPFLPDLSWYDGELAKDPYVKWVNLFGYAMVEPWVGLRFDVAEIDTERAKYIQWQQAGVIDLGSTPPVDPPPTGDRMITPQEIADSIAYTYSIANQWDLGEHRYGEVEKHAADGKDYIINLFAGGGVVVEKGHYGPSDAKFFDRKTFAISDAPPVLPPPPVTGVPPFAIPPMLVQYGASAVEGALVAGQSFYRLMGATVRAGVSAFCKVTVLGKSGAPAIGIKVVNRRPDGNQEVLTTDGSGIVQFFYGAGSAFSTPGTGPFSNYIDGFVGDRAISLGDFQGTHTEFYLQFQQVQ